MKRIIKVALFLSVGINVVLAFWVLLHRDRLLRLRNAEAHAEAMLTGVMASIAKENETLEAVGDSLRGQMYRVIASTDQIDAFLAERG